MQKYGDCPKILKEFLIYHETIKGQSKLTISEYYLDLRMFFRSCFANRIVLCYRSNNEQIMWSESKNFSDGMRMLSSVRIISPSSLNFSRAQSSFSVDFWPNWRRNSSIEKPSAVRRRVMRNSSRISSVPSVSRSGVSPRKYRVTDAGFHWREWPSKECAAGPIPR